jgi:hypothetical protein
MMDTVGHTLSYIFTHRDGITLSRDCIILYSVYKK